MADEWETLSPQRRENDGWETLPNGAAVGNPNLLRQGAKAARTTLGEGLVDIGGAGVIGGVLGAASPEILTGLGAAAGAFPATAPMAPFLTGTGNLLRGSRGAAAISGVVGGLTSESSGKLAEASGAGPVVAETARVAGGLVGPEFLVGAKELLKAYVAKPALGFMAMLKKQTGKTILEKLESKPETISEQEWNFIQNEIGALRGPAGKTNAPLENVGSIMGAEGDRLLTEADRQVRDAVLQGGQVGKLAPGATAQPADIGEGLRGSITTRNKAFLEARSKQYSNNEQMRNSVVEAKESSGKFVNDTSEYQALVADLKAELEPGKRSQSVQSNFQKILSDLSNPEKTTPEKKLVLSGQELNWKTDPAQNKPITFQALDDVRRKLGDAFRGKPAEGYDAIGEAKAKELYGKVSEIQKKFAGESQARLLDDYAEATTGLEIFSSKYGKKSTALDQYRDEWFANDPSSLPSTYFKTRESITRLKELTGNAAQVNSAALAHADQQLLGKTAPEVRAWMNKNVEWLNEVSPAHRVIAKYADRLEAAEVSMTNATEFATRAAKDSSLLTRQALPAQRAVDLIKSGDTELWSKVIPAIQQSPQAKTQMVQAVRQVVADQATSKGTIDLFERNIRPFIEGSQIATKVEMDFIAKRLDNIAKLNIPEAQKLGHARRMILEATGSWTASAAARGTTGAYNYMSNQVPPEQPFLQTPR